MCTQSAPCATLYYVTTSSCHSTWSVFPGDTIAVESGTYDASYTASLCGVTVNANPIGYINGIVGTASAPITVSASGGPVTITRALSADPTSQAYPLLWVKSSSYVTINGLTITGAKQQSDYNSAYAPYGGEVLMQASSHITLSNMSVSGANNTCIKDEDGEPNIAIEGSTVSNCGNPYNETVTEGTSTLTNVPTQDHDIYLPGPNALVEGNTLSGSTGFGIHLYGSNASGDQVLGNTVSGAYYAGVIAEAWSVSPNATIEDNTFSNNGACAWLYNGDLFALNTCNGDGGGINVNPSASVTIENDNVYGTPGSAIVNQGGSGTYFTGALSVQNDIFDGSGTQSVFNTPFTGPAPVMSHNDYDGYVVPSQDQGYSTTADPQFVSPGSNFHLQAGSPAIAAGTPVGLPYCGLAPDLGALRYCPRSLRIQP
jgi:parallel beta-helix repeat protein